MRRNGIRALTVVISTFALAATTGCSDGESEAVPELPERICWGVFTGGEIAPLMPTGKKAEMNADPFVFDEQRHDSATCDLYIDGRHGMLVNAKIRDFEDEVDWAPLDEANPKSIDVGERGIVWQNGAGTHIVCEPSKSPSDPGKYIELYMKTDRSPDKEKLRAALPGLLQQMVAFTKRELHCP